MCDAQDRAVRAQFQWVAAGRWYARENAALGNALAS
jgi:hypothetical protein